MKDFTLFRPRDLDEAVSLLPRGDSLENYGKTKLLAGGMDLVTELKEHLAEPDNVVDLKRISGLDRVEADSAKSVTIGALSKLEDIADHPHLRRLYTAVAEAAQTVASPQIRSQATLGGNLNQRPRCLYYRDESTNCLKKGGSECFAYSGNNRYNAILGGGPSYIVHPSDLAPALVALDAEIGLRGPLGERHFPLEDYYTLPSEAEVTRETVRAVDEIVTHVDVPAPPRGAKSTYLKFKERGSFDFALASVALSLVVEAGKIRRARLVLGGVAPRPWRAREAEQWLIGKTMELETWRGVGEVALSDADPLEQNGYKVPLTKGLIVRAMQRLS